MYLYSELTVDNRHPRRTNKKETGYPASCLAFMFAYDLDLLFLAFSSINTALRDKFTRPCRSISFTFTII